MEPVSWRSGFAPPGTPLTRRLLVYFRSGAYITNFPMLFSVTDSNLKSTGNGGYVGKSDGTDIFFTASDGSTKLNHELESYNASTGQVIAWVQIPSLSPTSDTTIYVYYGNSSASDQQNKTGVWDSNYKGVWHLPNGSSLSATDSTSSSNNSTTITATATTGELDGGAAFNGSQRISLPNIALSGTAMTLEAWIKVSSFVDYARIFAKSTASGGAPWEDYGLGGSSASSHQVAVSVGIGSISYSAYTSAISSGTWYHLVGAYDGSHLTAYLNGTAGTPASVSGSIANDSQITEIGYNTTYSPQSWNGSIDEVRISNIARSAGWITTEYNNQNSPSTFLSEGSQENVSTVATPTFSLGPQNLLTISDGTSGATIYYTTDGSTPTTGSPVYTGAVPLINQTPGYYTNYTYDWMDHLIQVSMPRGSHTQTRTFVYNDTPFLQSATNPENGTVT